MFEKGRRMESKDRPQKRRKRTGTLDRRYFRKKNQSELNAYNARLAKVEGAQRGLIGMGLLSPIFAGLIRYLLRCLLNMG